MQYLQNIYYKKKAIRLKLDLIALNFYDFYLKNNFHSCLYYTITIRKTKIIFKYFIKFVYVGCKNEDKVIYYQNIGKERRSYDRY